MLEANNNRGIIYRIAKSNLEGKRLYTFFSIVTIVLSLTFIMAVTLFLQGTKTAEERILDRMQHVMFRNIPEQELERAARDEKVELLLPYKEFGEEFEIQGVKYSFTYQKSQAEKIQTYVPAEGKEPEQYDEIVVDRGFMEQMGRECRIGEEIVLRAGDSKEEFVICGYTDRKHEMSVYPVYVSREYADKSQSMRDVPYTALVRLADASQMETAAFEAAVYQMAENYGVKRSDVNINGKFEESLRDESPIFQAMLLVFSFILAACGIVIYTIFYLSVTSRTRQIGQLLTIGMTEKQIRKMVRREGAWLCAASIPAALILGGIIAYALLPDGWSFGNYLFTAGATSVFGYAAVQISVSKPAALAAKVSPIEAARVLNDGGGEVKEKEKKHKKLTPFVIARIGQENSAKKQKLMTVSIAFGGIVFMIAATYLYAWDEKAFSRTGVFERAEYVISYLYNAHNPLPYGLTNMQLTGHLSKDFEERLLEIPYVRSVETEHAAYGNIEYQGASWEEGIYRLTERSEEFYQIKAEGNTDYEYLCETDGVFITDSDFLSKINGVSFRVGDTITLHWFDGEEHETELEIAAISSEASPAKGGYGIAMTDQTMEKLWGGMNTVSAFYVSVEEYEKYGDQTEEAIRALLEPYADLSLGTLREQMINDAADIQKIKMQIYGISAFMILFSVLNLVNMTIGNVAARKREFSMLEAIGMEEKQIRSMLFWENILFVLPAILITVVIGGAAGYGTVLVFQRIINVDYMYYRFPAALGLLFLAGMLLIPMLISYFSLKGVTPNQYNQDV